MRKPFLQYAPRPVARRSETAWGGERTAIPLLLGNEPQYKAAVTTVKTNELKAYTNSSISER